MLFGRRDDWWLAARVTGPTHQFLGLRFAGAPSPRRGVAPDAAQAAEIAAGVARANQALGSAYAVADSEVDPRDDFEAGIYAWLAQTLVERAHAAGVAWAPAPKPRQAA
ncbi:hypothetical protein [uncultured Thiodictyon sp.]|jgi:hypothetical protein|uniref:hypothetical protein n=1 Tax=uncultured Thiodictyon sp. TaxID=1846217 RepID=UPI0025D0FFC8|nr:hypothetical protein [uncultured Thiodictyon sp.]